MQLLKQHMLIVLAIVIVLAGVAWYEFSSSSSAEPTLTTIDVGNATDTQDAQLVTTLLQLQAVTLSGTILNNPGFLSLQDFTTQIVSEPVGRANPFAPITSQLQAAAATSSIKLTPNLFAPKSAKQ